MIIKMCVLLNQNYKFNLPKTDSVFWFLWFLSHRFSFAEITTAEISSLESTSASVTSLDVRWSTCLAEHECHFNFKMALNGAGES